MLALATLAAPRRGRGPGGAWTRTRATRVKSADTFGQLVVPPRDDRDIPGTPARDMAYAAVESQLEIVPNTQPTHSVFDLVRAHRNGVESLLKGRGIWPSQKISRILGQAAPYDRLERSYLPRLSRDAIFASEQRQQNHLLR
jgi:hypothetical protein